MNIVSILMDQCTDAERPQQILLQSAPGDLTPQQLRARTNQAANALRSLGLMKGHAIGMLMPPIIERTIACLAIINIGAVLVPLPCGLDADRLSANLVRARCRAIFIVDGFTRGGEMVNLKALADEAAMNAPDLRHMVMLRQTTLAVGKTVGEHWRDHWWHGLIESQSTVARTEEMSSQDLCALIRSEERSHAITHGELANDRDVMAVLDRLLVHGDTPSPH